MTQSTTDYGIFRTVAGNRRTTPSHVEGMTVAVDRKNLLEFYPILVNENMEIIDGQHRLMAAMKLNLPVYYNVVNGLKIEDIMSINTHSKNWSIQDFIDAYIKLDYSAYRTLDEFMRRHKVSASLAGSLLSGYTVIAGGGSVSKEIRNGTFQIKSEAYADEIINKIREVAPYCDFNTETERNFIRVITILRNNEDFDWDKFIAKLKMHNLRIGSRANINYYILLVEELYNFNAKVKTELYVSSQEK